MNKFWNWRGVLAATLVFTAALAGQASAQTVNVGYTPRMPQSPIFIAHEKGFFKEEGLDITLHPTNSATTALIPLLARGDLDVIFGGPTASLFNAMHQGMRFSIVADGGRIAPHFDGFPYLIVVRKDLYDAGAFKTLADMKGKTMSFGAEGTSLAYMMFRALEEAKLKPSDVNIRWFKSMTDIAVALENKALDATAMIAPINAGLTKKGISVDWKDAREVAPDMQAYMLIFSESFTNKRKDDSMKFLRAYAKAVAWYHEQLKGDAAELIEIVAKHTKMTPEQIKASPWTWYHPQLELNSKDLIRQYEMWVGQGLSKPGLPLAEFIREDLRAEALKK